MAVKALDDDPAPFSIPLILLSTILPFTIVL